MNEIRVESHGESRLGAFSTESRASLGLPASWQMRVRLHRFDATTAGCCYSPVPSVWAINAAPLSANLIVQAATTEQPDY